MKQHRSLTYALIGARGSGKTYEAKRMIRSLGIPKGNRFLICPTFLMDTTLKPLFDEENVFLTYSDDIIDHITKVIEDARKETDFKFHHRYNKDTDEYDVIKSRIGKKAKMPRFILVADDCLGSNAFKGNSKFSTMFAKHRHYLLDIIAISQIYKGLPPIVRVNSMIYKIWEQNRREGTKIAEEHGGTYDVKDFLDMLGDRTAERYEFLTIDYRKPRNKRYY